MDSILRGDFTPGYELVRLWPMVMIRDEIRVKGKALDTQLGLTKRLATCLDDPREPGKVVHETIELCLASPERAARHRAMGES